MSSHDDDHRTPMERFLDESTAIPTSVEPSTSAVAAAEDLFDEAAPPLQAPAAARLVPLVPSATIAVVDVRVDDDAHGLYVLGRSKELRPPYRIDGCAKISSRHCQVTIDPATRVVRLTDLSTNGTFLNGTRVKKGEAVVLHQGDRIDLTAPPAEGTNNNNTNSSSNDGGVVAFLFVRLVEETSVVQLVEELTCSICRGLLHRPCSLLPCMHTFCAGCISEWVRQQPAERPMCVECRSCINEIRPTHKIKACVEQLLRADESLRRPAEEIARLEAVDTIPPAGKIIGNKKRGRDGDDDDDEEEANESDGSHSSALDDGDEAFVSNGQPLRNPLFAFHLDRPTQQVRLPTQRCVQCSTPSTEDGFQCPEGGPHLLCSACRRPFPERPLCPRPQRCHLCSASLCDLYMHADGGCAAAPGAFRPLAEHVFTCMPPKTFSGNMVEQGILSSYLANAHLSPATVWATCIEKLRAGEWVPDLSSVRGPLTAESATCTRCAATVFSALLFHFRRSIPADDLPEAVSRRPNCWYGLQCRTQHHNVQHAQKMNHVCYQEKRKE